MNKKIKTAVISKGLMRTGLAKLLRESKQIEVLFNVSDNAQTLEQLKFKMPDVVVLSVEEPYQECQKILASLKLFPQIRTVVLLDGLYDSLVTEFLEKGANAILTKNISLDTLTGIINEVHTKGFYYTSEIMQVIGGRLEVLLLPSQYCGITTREAEVANLIFQGKSSKQIAELLFISPKTVENHRYNLYKKIGGSKHIEIN